MSEFDDLVSALCQSGVEFRTLGDVGKFIRGGGLQKSDLTDSGFPAIHYGQIHTHYGTWATQTQSFVTEKMAERLRKAEPGDLVLTTTSEDDQAVGKAVAWLGPTSAAVSGDAYIFRHTLVPKFVSYFFQSKQFQAQKRRNITGTKVRRISGDSLAKIRIPVPPVVVQEKVVALLDQLEISNGQLAEELQAESESRRRQYVYYRDFLLAYPQKEVPRVPLGELVSMRAGHFMNASDIRLVQDAEHPYPCFGGNGLRGYVPRANHEGDYILIGRQGALSGNVKRVSGPFYATEHAIVATMGPSVLVDWVFHMLTKMNLNQFVSKGAQPGLAVRTLNALLMPVPDVEEQRRAASILDNLDALVSELSENLLAELRARRTQYDHYLNRLLTFQESEG